MTENINVNGNRKQFTIPQMAEAVSSQQSHVSGSLNLEPVLFQHIVMLLWSYWLFLWLETFQRNIPPLSSG